MKTSVLFLITFMLHFANSRGKILTISEKNPEILLEEDYDRVGSVNKYDL